MEGKGTGLVHSQRVQVTRQGRSGHIKKVVLHDPQPAGRYFGVRNDKKYTYASLWQSMESYALYPNGGSFSAQSADLHSCWGAYQGRRLLRSLGELCFTEFGFMFWRRDEGVMTMCQFRDNILVGSSYPDSGRVQLIHTVCSLLGDVWNLKVVCDC